MTSTKVIKANVPLSRRNTMESFFSDELNEESDIMESEEGNLFYLYIFDT